MRVHIVQKGDTLWKIAKQYAVGFEELKRLNAHLANPDYIVPGMEIYLPEMVVKKEKEVVQQQVVKEHIKEQVKEHVKPIKEVAPAPKPIPAPMPVPVPQKPLWQGDIYFQPPPQPMSLPFQQTHVHFQPTIEQTMSMPIPQPVVMPQMMPQQPIIIQQPAPQPAPQPEVKPQPQPVPQQPIYIEQPVHWHPPMPQMHHMPTCHKCGHGMKMPEPPRVLPIRQEESSAMPMCGCKDREHQVRNYYEEIQQMMCMPNPCCSPHMMPYPMHMMPQMQPVPHPMHMMPQMMPQMDPQMMPQMMPQMDPQMMPQMMPQMNPMPHPQKPCH